MKYSMVKQFSNAALDNIFSFFFKWVDFAKVLYEAFLAFLEIWYAFSMIFVNAFMYVYYLFLFLIDQGADSGQSARPWKKGVRRSTAAPKIHIPKGPNPVPAIYGVKSAASSALSTAASAIPSARAASSKTRGKRQIGKTILEFFSSIFYGIKAVITKPFIAIGNFFTGKLKPVREKDSHPAEPAKRSLIDEYIKEYEKKRLK